MRRGGAVVLVVCIEIEDDVLCAAGVAELDGERTLRGCDARIADDGRQYIEYQRQSYEADPARRRTFHHVSGKSERAVWQASDNAVSIT
jgi:hypothetical protein